MQVATAVLYGRGEIQRLVYKSMPHTTLNLSADARKAQIPEERFSGEGVHFSYK